MKHNATYEQMGRAALIPGMQYLIERMQGELDQMRASLAAIQNGDEPQAKRKYTRRGAAEPQPGRLASGWPADPEERRKEMLRRQAVARAKNPKFRAKVGKGQKAAWARLTPAERQARIERANAARMATAARKKEAA